MVQLVGSNSLGLSKVIDGKTQYIHIKYSAYEDGMIMTDTAAEDTKFIGVLVTFNSQPSPMPGDYSWARFVVPGDKGADGVAGKDGVGLKSTTITYGLSSTETTQPTTYTSEVPPLTKGQYLWTKTVWKYTDTTTETGYTKTYIAKDGNSGEDGLAGKDGVGISSTKIEYAGSTSGTVKPTSGWNTAVPTVAAGNFLWTKTTWTYTDNTTETGYSVARMGSNGAPGEKGDAGTSSYTWIRYSPNADGSSMTEKPQANSLYIGVAITSSNSVPKANTEYTWALIKGDKGDTGDQGAPGVNAPTIKSVVQQFYLSTSKTSQTGGSWLSTVPVWSSGKYYWVRVLTTYSNNASSTSTPVLDNALNESLVTALEVKTANQDLSTTVTQHATLIEGKANSTTVDAIAGRVTTAEGSISAVAGEVALKASTTDVNALTGRVSTAEGKITTQAGLIELKANAEDVDTLTGRVSAAESSLSVQSSHIALSVTKTELTTAIDGIEVGTRNLLRDSNIEFSFGEDDNKYIWDAYRDNTWEVLGD